MGTSFSVRIHDDRSVEVLVATGRVAIGAGFLAAPVLSTRVLGLDTATAKRVAFLYGPIVLAADLGQARGPEPRTPVLVTHDQHEALSLSHHIAVMRDGLTPNTLETWLRI